MIRPPWAPGRAIRLGLAGAALLLLYAIPAIVYLQPIWSMARDHLAGRSADPLLNLYLLKWGVHQLGMGMPDFWDANFFYPARGALAFGDHLLAPALQIRLMLRLGLAPNAIAGYNLLLLGSFVLSGAATCWVLRRSGRSWTAAVLGGYMYAFAPTRWAHLEHIQILLAQWIPLTLWTWDRLLAEPAWKRAAIFLPFYLLHLAGGCYLAYMIHVPMLALLLSRGAAVGKRLLGWRHLRVLLAVALVAAAAAYLLFSPYVEVARRYDLKRSPGEVALYSATLLSYLAPSDRNLYAGGWHRLVDPWKLELSNDESRLFAGFVATAFCVVGVLAFWRRHRTAPVRPPAPWQRAVQASLLVVAMLSFLAGDLRTLGPEPQADSWDGPALGFALGLGLWLAARRLWGGNWPLRGTAIEPWERGIALGGALCFLLSFPLAFIPLARFVPGLTGMRAPGRFYVMTSLAVVCFAALGLDEILPAERRRRRLVAAALALALLVELAPVPARWRAVRDEPDFPPVYRYLRSADQVRAVLELPRLPPAGESLYMYYSTEHWRPLANGYSGFYPASAVLLRAKIPLLPDAEGFSLLRQIGVTHLVVHLSGPPGRPIRERLPSWEGEFLGREIEEVFREGPDRVYRLLPLPPPGRPRAADARAVGPAASTKISLLRSA